MGDENEKPDNLLESCPSLSGGGRSHIISIIIVIIGRCCFVFTKFERFGSLPVVVITSARDLCLYLKESEK